ncbi:MAG: DUF2330 domain-containing protein [Myxococcales bacterium]|nr:DUF2330 domain-containing protein [Myxococcales bacterium]MCB9578792.1 DUF2330 domain-containing protein [Polyangiaceae bacterium]
MALTSTLCLAFTGPARAAGRLLDAPGDSLRVERWDVALAEAPQHTTVWLRANVKGTGKHFVLVVPAPPGSVADPALDAWLDALDSATAPRIQPPKGTLECGETVASSVESLVESDAAATAHPTKVAVAKDLAELLAFAQNEGVELTAADDAAISGVDPSARFIALAYDKSGDRARTETLRLTVPLATPKIPFGVARSSDPVSVLLYAVAPGRAQVQGAEVLEPDQVGTTWNVLSATSDYASARDALLVQKQGAAWMVEAAGSAPLYQWLLLPGQSGSISPAVHAYFTEAKAAGATSSAVAECLSPLWDAKDSGALGATLLPYCAPGLLASVPSSSPPASCVTQPGPGEIAVQPLVCGSADDVAAALGGLNASEVELTRQVGVIAAQTPDAASVTFTNGLSVSPLQMAGEADTTGCVTGSGGSSGGPGTGGSSGSGGNGGGIGGPGELPPPGGPDYGEQPADSNVDVGVSCTGSSEGSGCSGDSSDSSSSDGCSGDSSNSNGSSDGCSGDSSDSSDSCSGDSSSSSSGDGCSGDSSSSGDGCSGDSSGSSGCSSSSGGDGCTVSIHGRRRPHVSALAFGLIALLLPLRRFGARRKKK